MKSRRVRQNRFAVIRTDFTKGILRQAFTGVAIALVFVACDTTSDGCECNGEMNDDGACIVTDEALAEAQTTEGELWESAPWQGAPWLCFDSGMKLRIDHSLGYPPALVQVYLSFANSDDGPGSAFLASGDLARIVEVTDAYVLIENNTEEYFFVRVVLE
jgi:hypothetical protein